MSNTTNIDFLYTNCQKAYDAANSDQWITILKYAEERGAIAANFTGAQAWDWNIECEVFNGTVREFIEQKAH